jgi:hypothetical protein
MMLARNYHDGVAIIDFVVAPASSYMVVLTTAAKHPRYQSNYYQNDE